GHPPAWLARMIESVGNSDAPVAARIEQLERVPIELDALRRAGDRDPELGVELAEMLDIGAAPDLHLIEATDPKELPRVLGHRLPFQKGPGGRGTAANPGQERSEPFRAAGVGRVGSAPMRKRLIPLFALLALAGTVAGCNGEKGSNERRAIVAKDQELVLRVFRDDPRRGVIGVRRAADMMDRGFLVEDPEQRERELRTVMRRVQQPPRAIEELMISPISFLAAVDTDGKVIARDVAREDDRMRGFDMAEVSPPVRRALEEGESGYEMAELPSSLETDPPSVTILFAAPARHEGRIVGAMVSGIPLWRLGQQLSNQLRGENAEHVQQGGLVWALVYRGDQLHWHAG